MSSSGGCSWICGSGGRVAERWPARRILAGDSSPAASLVACRDKASGGDFTEHGWRTDLVFVDCRYVAEFTVNGIPALELRNRSGDVTVRKTAGTWR